MFFKLFFVFFFALASVVLPVLSTPIYLPEGFNGGKPLAPVSGGFKLPLLAAQSRRGLEPEVEQMLMKRFIDLQCTPKFAGARLPAACDKPRFPAPIYQTNPGVRPLVARALLASLAGMM